MAEIEQEPAADHGEDSLSTALGAAFDEVFKDSDEDRPEPPAEQQSAQDGAQPAEKPADTPEKPVDTPEKAADTPEKPADTPEQAAGQQDAPSAAGEETEPLPPPQHWPADQQEAFAELPPLSQKFMLDAMRGMEAAHTRRSQEVAPLRAAMARWTPYLQQTGDTPDQAFDTLMQTERTLRTGTNEQRKALVLDIIHRYGVDFGNGNGAPGNGTGAQPEDQFGIRKMVNEAVAGSEERFRRLEGHLQAREQAERQAHNARLQGAIQEFVDAKGPDGKPSHPHVQQVWPEMAMIAETVERSGGVPDIADCYEKACRINPQVWEKIQTADRLASTAKTRREDQERARKAKVAAGGLGGAGGGGVSMPSDITEQLGQAYDEAFAS